MQTFLMVLVIVVLMAPLLLVYGIPFIVPASLLHTYTGPWLGERARLILSCSVASMGIAPAFDDFWAPKSIYLRLFEGEPVNPGAASLSLVITCIVLALAVSAYARLRARQGA